VSAGEAAAERTQIVRVAPVRVEHLPAEAVDPLIYLQLLDERGLSELPAVTEKTEESC
jgi:hypothetical protein